MIIRGHSGQDIRRMLWRRKFKLLAVAVLIFIAVTLTGCTKPKPTLKALDRFWDTLGGKTTDLVEETK
jgi:hypothetical protein